MKHNLEDIIAFAYVAKFKSFTKAANFLNIARAVITLRVSRLEKEMDLVLLIRTTRDVSLTSEGESFAKYCELLIKKYEGLDDFLDKNRGSISGVLKIVLPPYFSRYHIVPYLDEFLKKYPKLTLEIILTENPVNIISEGFDLQIRIQVPEEEDLETAKLVVNSKILCASKEYIVKHPIIKNPRDLLNHNCIIFGENNVWKFKHQITGDMVELRDMWGNIRCDNGEIIKELLLSGVGVTLKSACDIADELQDGRIVALLPDYEVMHKTQFYAVYPAQRKASPKIMAFVEFFQEKLKKTS